MLGGYIWFGQAVKVRKNRAELAANGEKTGELNWVSSICPSPPYLELGPSRSNWIDLKGIGSCLNHPARRRYFGFPIGVMRNIINDNSSIGTMDHFQPFPCIGDNQGDMEYTPFLFTSEEDKVSC